VSAGRKAGADFRCGSAFQCSGMADDFRCHDNAFLAFQCGEFGGCNPSGSSGTFRCNRANGEFACTDGFACTGGFTNA